MSNTKSITGRDGSVSPNFQNTRSSIYLQLGECMQCPVVGIASITIYGEQVQRCLHVTPLTSYPVIDLRALVLPNHPSFPCFLRPSAPRFGGTIYWQPSAKGAGCRTALQEACCRAAARTILIGGSPRSPCRTVGVPYR